MDGIWEVSTAPTVEPISTADMKTHLRVDSDADDTYIGELITAAREAVEIRCNRALITQTLKLYLDNWPTETIYLPQPPAQSVTSIAYTDTAGDSQTWTNTYYTVDTVSEPARVVCAYGQTWPALRDVIKAVTITYKAGYGDAASNVPERFVHIVRLLVSHFYEMREPIITGTIVTKIPDSIEALIWNCRIKEIHA